MCCFRWVNVAFTQPTNHDKESIFKHIKIIFKLKFPSPRLVVIPSLESIVYPTIYPLLKKRIIGFKNIP